MNAARVKKIRTDLDLTQEKFAHFLDVAFATVNRWENDHAHPVGLVSSLLEDIERALKHGASAEKLIEAGRGGPAELFAWLAKYRRR